VKTHPSSLDLWSGHQHRDRWRRENAHPSSSGSPFPHLGLIILGANPRRGRARGVVTIGRTCADDVRTIVAHRYGPADYDRNRPEGQCAGTPRSTTNWARSRPAVRVRWPRSCPPKRARARAVLGQVRAADQRRADGNWHRLGAPACGTPTPHGPSWRSCVGRPPEIKQEAASRFVQGRVAARNSHWTAAIGHDRRAACSTSCPRRTGEDRKVAARGGRTTSSFSQHGEHGCAAGYPDVQRMEPGRFWRTKLGHHVRRDPARRQARACAEDNRPIAVYLSEEADNEASLRQRRPWHRALGPPARAVRRRVTRPMCSGAALSAEHDHAQRRGPDGFPRGDQDPHPSWSRRGAHG